MVERLDRHDADALLFAYSIINEDCPLPVANYSATVLITPTGSDRCNVNWSGTFEPKGASEAEAVKLVESIYRGGIAGARQSLGAG